VIPERRRHPEVSAAIAGVMDHVVAAEALDEAARPEAHPFVRDRVGERLRLVDHEDRAAEHRHQLERSEQLRDRGEQRPDRERVDQRHAHHLWTRLSTESGP
jgi:hypothetical protein